MAAVPLSRQDAGMERGDGDPLIELCAA